MQTNHDLDDSPAVSTGIIIGILDVLAMIAIIAFLYSKDIRI